MAKSIKELQQLLQQTQEENKALKNENEKLKRKLLLANDDTEIERKRFYDFVSKTEHLIKGINSSLTSAISQVSDFEKTTLLVD